MPNRRTALAITALLVTVVAAVTLLTVLLSTTPEGNTRTPTSSLPSTPGPVVVAPSVALLEPGTILITHDATAAATGFGKGVLEIAVPFEEDQFRFIAGAAPALGGRVVPNEDMLASLPSNLPIVVSFSTAEGPVSIFGRLATSPTLNARTITYTFSIFDAPGEGSTYTVSGQYKIPEELTNVRVTIAGQTAAQ